MACQRDVARLLAKGLSGAEAGRLALAELLALDGGGGLLSERDVEALRSGLTSDEDRAECARLLGLYRTLRFTLLEAEVAALRAGRLLAELERLLTHYLTSARVARLAGLAQVSRQDEGSAEEPDEQLEAYLRDCLADVMDVKGLEAAYEQRRGRTLPELLEDLRTAACLLASVLLAYLQAADEASASAGVSFREHVGAVVPCELRALARSQHDDDLLAEVRAAFAGVGFVIGELAEEGRELGAPQLAPLAFAELRPDALTLAILRERIAVGLDGGRGLGAKWWSAGGQ
jgi:hypothetical protein